MNVLLYSYCFLPSIGGIEMVSATLAEQLTKAGIHVDVVTETPSDKNDNFPCPIYRNPGWKERLRLVRKNDIIYSNGTSIALFWYAFFLGKPFVWTHGGYQLMCIDGLGWVEGEKAPLTPFKSILFHLKKRGLFFAIKRGLLLYFKRFIGKNLVARNIAITNWVAKRQPLPKQTVIYNPFPLERFKSCPQGENIEYDFLYVGRLVSEKGVATLIKAFAVLLNNKIYKEKKLLIVGDGNWKERLVQLGKDLNVLSAITFAGKKTGDELIRLVSHCRIAIIPSEWEEPMGGVAMEMMAARKNLIVSKNGGLSECTGNAALTFTNGNENELAACMERLLTDELLRKEQLQEAEIQLKKFDETALSEKYISLFREITSK